jgi:hypothetical protein
LDGIGFHRTELPSNYIATFASSVTLLLEAASNAQQFPSSSSIWLPENAARPFPGLELDFGGECDDVCRLSVWHFLLAENDLSELTAPPGGRAYRWIWMPAYSPKELGYIQVVIPTTGPATIKSSWQIVRSQLDAHKLIDFETMLAKSTFTSLSVNDQSRCLDECKDDLLEVVIDGQYHFVERAGGIAVPDVYNALGLLEKLARDAARYGG